ncbi:MAG: zinc ribbon domain-containing protein [bacterium]|nr:zinc ribbon domain-containing protein [bacterium]
MSKEISGPRQAAYYIGMGIMAIGIITFISVFFNTPDPAQHFGSFKKEADDMSTRAITGMILVGIGAMIQTIGARGLAGSGVILDPKKARGELEPYSRMAGGMAKDALDEADIDLGGKSEQVVMVRCTKCRKLNEEDSKFCQECGEAI